MYMCVPLCQCDKKATKIKVIYSHKNTNDRDKINHKNITFTSGYKQVSYNYIKPLQQKCDQLFAD